MACFGFCSDGPAKLFRLSATKDVPANLKVEVDDVRVQGQQGELPSLMMSKLNSSDNVRKKAKHFVRTGADEIVSPAEALQALILGNERYRSGIPVSQYQHSSMGGALVEYGQSPFAAVIGCADSRCPVDTLFDAMPGDLFVCRNAGNTCTHAEGSMVGSLEFCVTALRARLIVVLGHTKCGAVAGATKMYLDKKEKGSSKDVRQSALQGLLDDLANVAEKAQNELPKGASVDEITNHAVQVNVFNTIDFLLKFSKPLRDMVKSGEVEIQGAVYDLKSGRVDFLGRSPTQDKTLASEETLPPSMPSTR